MDNVILTIGGHPVTLGLALACAGVLALALLGLVALQVAGAARGWRTAALETRLRSEELESALGEMTARQAQMTGRLQTLAEIFGTRQNDLASFLTERMEGLQHRVGQGLEISARHTAGQLAGLNERLAVIDAAQKNLSDLTGQVAGLRDVLSNKQARGAFGQGRMEAIVRDGLPPRAYVFQATLSNGRKPDCLVRLPGDAPLAIDAKFPLEAFTAWREAANAEAKHRAMQRVRNDVGLHIRSVADKYLLPGETQNLALLFVPSESLYADLHEAFDDIIQRAHRSRVLIVSPSLFSMAIQLVQTLVRDARIREEAHTIQTEVRRLLDDIGRLRERVEKLDAHFRQAQEDVCQIRTSAEKISRRGDAIATLEFEAGPNPYTTE